MKLDWTLTIGNVITLFTILVGFLSAYYGIRNKLNLLEELFKFRIERLEKDVDSLWERLREVGSHE